MSDWPFESAVLDTNVVWAAFSRRGDGDRPTCRQILRAGEAGELKLYVSAMTLVELFKVPDDEVTLEDVAVVNSALASPSWEIVELYGHLSLQARELALEHDIRSPHDAAILATAVLVGAHRLITHDTADLPVGEIVEGVLIALPSPPQQTTLDINSPS